MKILTVDDARTVRTMLRHILQDAYHEVHEAENGNQALDKIRSDTFDIILLDWEMPEMDGLTFLTEVRKKNLAPNTKIIMLTSLNKMANILKALEAGANEYIMKPFTPEVVIDKINATVGKK